MATPPLPRGRQGTGAALLLGGCLLILTGCSGTPLGEQLSRSFPAPASPGPTTGGNSAGGGAPGNPAPPAPSPTGPGTTNASTANPNNPTGPSAAPAAAGQAPAAGAAPASGTPAGAPKAAAAKAGAGGSGTPRAGAGNSEASSPAAALQPAPYRVILKLPSADPAAPAELVTQALRAAGVRFEVETIERLGEAAPSTATGSRAPR